MGAVLGVLIIVGLVWTTYAYQKWLRRGMRPRELTTALPPGELRQIFADKVASMGWHIVPGSEPLLAQSPLMTGIRQQIELTHSATADGRVRVKIFVRRYTRLWLRGTPTKSHTLRIRMNGFVHEVCRRDPTARIADPYRVADGQRSPAAPTPARPPLRQPVEPATSFAPALVARASEGSCPACGRAASGKFCGGCGTQLPPADRLVVDFGEA